MRSFIFGEGQEAKTPAQLARMRELADAMMAANGRAPQNVGEGLQSIGNAILYRSMMGKIDAGEKAGRTSANAAFGNIAAAMAGKSAFPAAPGAKTSSSTVPAASRPENPNLPSRLDFARSDADSALPASFMAAVDGTEGGGDYDTLFGHAQRDGGGFAGTRVSEMPISDVLAFADPSGPYAQSVKAKIGRVATPMGRHQIVGTTLRNAVAEMGIDPNTPFNRQTQNSIAAHLAKNRVASADTMGGKIAALRSEWEGFKNVPDAQMQQIVTDLESGSTGGAVPPAVAAIGRQAPIQVASLDPSAGMSSLPPMPEEYAKAGLSEEAWKRMNAPDGAVRAEAATVPPAPAAPAAAVPQSAPPQPAQGQQQIAQAMMDNLPVTAGGNAGAIGFDAQGGPDLQTLVNAAGNEFLSDSQRGIVDALIKQRMESADPLRQLQLKKLQREIDAPVKDWQKLDDNTLFSPSTGEIKEVAGQSPGKFRFGGNSVQAQALNGLMDSGKLTEEQAQQLAAGKMVTNPADGSIIFMTPDGIFAQPQGGAPAAPASPQNPPPPVPADVPADQPPAAPPTRPGVIPLTDPKAVKPTESQRNRVSNVGQAFDAINTELDRYADLVEKSGIEAMPGQAKDNLNAVRQGIMLQLKELFNLGVLNGPDLELMEKMIYDPVVDPLKDGGFANLPDQLYTSVTGGAGQRAKNSVAELKRMIGGIKASVDKSSSVQQPAAQPTPQAVTLPDGVTEEDIQHTMQVHGLTREQVLERLR